MLGAQLELHCRAIVSGAPGTTPWRDPARSTDLLALLVGHFYESDRERWFWRLDELVAHSFPESCRALAVGLDDTDCMA